MGQQTVVPTGTPDFCDCGSKSWGVKNRKEDAYVSGSEIQYKCYRCRDYTPGTRYHYAVRSPTNYALGSWFKIEDVPIYETADSPDIEFRHKLGRWGSIKVRHDEENGRHEVVFPSQLSGKWINKSDIGNVRVDPDKRLYYAGWSSRR